MSQIQVVMVSRLSEHTKASALIPEMTEKEWNDFLKNVEGNGIRQPLDVNQNYEVLDGRHRLRAAIKLGIEQVEVRQHDLTEDEEIKFVRDTAIERRNLTPAQKLSIIFNTEELVRGIYEEGVKAKVEGNKRGASITNKTALGPTDPQPKPSYNSNEKLGEMAGVSASTVKRMKRLKNEDSALYQQVVEGEKSASTAYKELPKKPRGNQHMTKAENEKVVKTELKQPPSLPQNTVDKQMFNANVNTFIMHAEQLIGFIERTENIDEVISEATNRIDAAHYTDEFKKIIKLLKIGGSTNE